MKINSDLDRFKNIIKNKIKHNLGKFVSSEKMIAQQGSKKITIPLDSIHLPIFSYGSNKGGVSQGDGEIGDGLGGGKSKNGGKAGNESESHDFSTEFSPEELAEIMMEHLELPRLEPKGKGEVSSEKNKYNTISNNGPEALKHFKRTFKEALKREISTGTYDPNNPKIVPIKSDKRYKSYSTKENPEINAVAFYILDCSGSMEDEQRKIVKSVSFWIDILLRNAYKNIESVFIIHDTEAQVVSREDFYKVSSGGGTRISSAYELCAKLIEEKYNHSEWNSYIYQFSDGDSFGDNPLCMDILKNNLLNNCNAFSYGQVKSNMGSGEFIKWLFANINDEKVSIAEINDINDVLKTIKIFFEKGK